MYENGYDSSIKLISIEIDTAMGLSLLQYSIIPTSNDSIQLGR